MGLALVEFVMEVEEAFGVTFTDEDAGRIRTPNDLVDYLLSRLPGVERWPCPTQRAFHELRRAGMRTLRQPRSNFRPQASWIDLIPARERPWRWRALGRALGIPSWPELRLLRRLPRGLLTVGDTARWIVRKRPTRFPLLDTRRERFPDASRKVIKAEIARLMAEQFDLHDFSWDASFIGDLGLD